MVKHNRDIDFEKIMIYPKNYDKKTRKKLDSYLKKLGIKFEYEQYA